MEGYWNLRDATEAAIKDGWFCTGDIGRVDEDGYCYIIDRKKDLIIHGGYNVYPREIEEVFYEHPAVAGLLMYAQVNDHYVNAIRPYLGDPTTFGDGHSLGARLGIESPARHWDTSVWVTNLTDTRPLTYAFAGSEGQRVSFYQKPRSVGVEFMYRL